MKLQHTLPLLMLVLAACSPAAQQPTVDPQVYYTAAAKTVVAEFTLTAAANPPTVEVTPTTEASQTATVAPELTTTSGTPFVVSSGTAVLCDHLSFDPGTVDVNIPDNTEMTPGQDFVKTWRVKNDGGCAWGAGYGLVYGEYETRMSGQPVPLASVVAVGQEVEISVNFKAPTDPGVYVSAWQMANDKGLTFPKAIYVKIVVR